MGSDQQNTDSLQNTDLLLIGNERSAKEYCIVSALFNSFVTALLPQLDLSMIDAQICAQISAGRCSHVGICKNVFF